MGWTAITGKLRLQMHEPAGTAQAAPGGSEEEASEQQQVQLQGQQAQQAAQGMPAFPLSGPAAGLGYPEDAASQQLQGALQHFHRQGSQGLASGQAALLQQQQQQQQQEAGAVQAHAGLQAQGSLQRQGSQQGPQGGGLGAGVPLQMPLGQPHGPALLVKQVRPGFCKLS